MEVVQVVGPSYYPVTRAEAKTHLNIYSSNTDHDGYIDSLIHTATALAERYTNRRFVYQTVKCFLDIFPCGDFIRLPFGQLKSVTHLKYKDTDGDQSTWAASNYIVDTDSEPGRIVLSYGKSWPTLTLYPSNPVEVQFVFGWYMAGVWTAGATIAENDLVIPTTFNELVYQAGGAGTSHAETEPTWPTTIGGTVTDNDVTWTCLGKAVPEMIRHAIKVGIAELFENREDSIVGGYRYVSLKTMERLLWPFKLHAVAP